VEDAPSGLKAGHAAGAQTLAVCTSHTKADILKSGVTPDFIVKNLEK
jgi:beta-phosphoglucomutase-like phosphatase (HAD superfamily)